jgi:hypothetical protein
VVDSPGVEHKRRALGSSSESKCLCVAEVLSFPPQTSEAGVWGEPIFDWWGSGSRSRSVLFSSQHAITGLMAVDTTIEEGRGHSPCHDVYVFLVMTLWNSDDREKQWCSMDDTLELR